MYVTQEFLSKIYRVGLLFLTVLVLADLLTFFFYPDSFGTKVLLATREQTPLTWLSSVSLLLIAFACASAYMQHKKRIWYFLAITFFFFSLDDAIYLHERLSGYVQNHATILQAFPSYSWVILYLPLLIFALGALLHLLWRGAKSRKQRVLVLSALSLLAVALGLDLIDGLVEKQHEIVLCFDPMCHMIMTHIIRLTEEVAEVISFGLLGYILLSEYSYLTLLRESERLKT